MIDTLTDSPRGPIRAITLRHGSLSARILTLGAAVQGLWRAGTSHSLVLGYANPLDYLDNPAYLGAIVGRVANRIGGARVPLNGRVLALDANEKRATTLHGGQDGCSRRMWRIADHGPAHVTLVDHLPDGHMGFPGALDVRVTYRLLRDTLCVDLAALAGADTVCALAPHLYFSLDGSSWGGARRIDAHLLRVNADHFIPVLNGVPTGGPVPVTGALDLRTPAPVPQSLDHHFCIAPTRGPLRPVAQLDGGDLSLRIDSSEPGLQVYDGGALPVLRGLDGPLGPRAGIALEPHAWIDAPNRAWAAQVHLRAGQTWAASTRFTFAPRQG